MHILSRRDKVVSTPPARKRFRAADEISNLDGLGGLIEHVTDLVFSDEDVAHPDLATEPKYRYVILNNHVTGRKRCPDW